MTFKYQIGLEVFGLLPETAFGITPTPCFVMKDK
jgi:hypothetical protein